jgi:hypothetical protein
MKKAKFKEAVSLNEKIHQKEQIINKLVDDKNVVIVSPEKAIKKLQAFFSDENIASDKGFYAVTALSAMYTKMVEELAALNVEFEAL